MTAKELNSYEIQTVKMCIQTYVNLYGVMLNNPPRPEEAKSSSIG